MTSIGGTNRRIIGATSGVSGGGKNGAGSVASGAMSLVAGRMAASVADQLKLGDDGGDDLRGSSSDPYEIEQLIEELAKELDGSPAEKGNLSHSLHSFVQEGAALFVARPEARALSHIDGAIQQVGNDNSNDASMRSVATLVDRATEAIRRAV